jgi:hypothetical protein
MNYWCSCPLSTIFQIYWGGGRTGETHYHAASHWQMLSLSTAQLWWWKTLIDCIVKCKYYYNAFATWRRPMQTRLSVIQLQSRIIATNTKALFFYYNLCTSPKLDSVSCSFISIFFLSFFTKRYKNVQRTVSNRQTLGESASLPQYLGCNTVFDMRLRVTFLRRKTVSLQSNIAHRE